MCILHFQDPIFVSNSVIVIIAKITGLLSLGSVWKARGGEFCVNGKRKEKSPNFNGGLPCFSFFIIQNFPNWGTQYIGGFFRI